VASFHSELQQYDLRALADSVGLANDQQVDHALVSHRVGPREFLALLSPAASGRLEDLAQKSRSVTLSHFGRVIQLYAPLYLSNYCSNNCLYCGFRRENVIERKIQDPAEVAKEAAFLAEQGFRSILLVAGEDSLKCGIPYLREVISVVHKIAPSVSLEIAPQSLENYEELREAGAEGVVVYQETYDRDQYAKFHPSGRKKDFVWRLETPERVARAGFHRVGIGALLGLAHPLEAAIALYLHTSFLLKNYWNCRVTISLPRMRQARGSIAPPFPVDDQTLIQLICALRIAYPEIGIVLSTREGPRLRDGVIEIGVTHISAGSRTEPGGYLEPDADKEQFPIEDGRSPAEVARMLATHDYEPVWKDWETTLV